MRRANHITRAAHLQICLGNPKPVFRLPQHLQPAAAPFGQRRLIHQQTGRFRLAPPHAATQLVQLRQTKDFRPFDHHDRGVGNVHPHLDHRGRHQHLGLARLKLRHGGVFLRGRHLPMHQPHDPLAQNRAQMFEPLFRRRQIQLFGFLDQRTHPVTLPPLGDGRPHPAHDLLHPLDRDDGCLDRLPPGRFFIKDGDIHIPILRQRQAAWNGRRRHHHHIHRRPLAAQLQSLAHTEPVLLVDHGQPKILKLHIFLKHRVRAHQHMDIPARECGKFRRPLLALVATRQDFHHYARAFSKRLQPFQMLPREDLCRRHHHALPAGLHRNQQRHEGHQRLPSPHIALQQAVHSHGLSHVARDICHRAGLRARHLIRQRRAHLGLQLTCSHGRMPLGLAQPHARQRQGQLMREEFVISQPRPRGRRGHHILQPLRSVRATHRSGPIGPALLLFQRRVDPFRQIRQVAQHMI